MFTYTLLFVHFFQYFVLNVTPTIYFVIHLTIACHGPLAILNNIIYLTPLKTHYSLKSPYYFLSHHTKLKGTYLYSILIYASTIKIFHPSRLHCCLRPVDLHTNIFFSKLSDAFQKTVCTYVHHVLTYVLRK